MVAWVRGALWSWAEPVPCGGGGPNQSGGIRTTVEVGLEVAPLPKNSTRQPEPTFLLWFSVSFKEGHATWSLSDLQSVGGRVCACVRGAVGMSGRPRYV